MAVRASSVFIEKNSSRLKGYQALNLLKTPQVSTADDLSQAIIIEGFSEAESLTAQFLKLISTGIDST